MHLTKCFHAAAANWRTFAEVRADFPSVDMVGQVLSFNICHNPYRLIVSDRPQVENVSPRAVQVGVASELTVFGRNLGAGSKRVRVWAPAS